MATIYESLHEGLPRIRLTWILADHDHCTWRNEYTLDGSTWTLIEEYQMEAGALVGVMGGSPESKQDQPARNPALLAEIVDR